MLHLSVLLCALNDIFVFCYLFITAQQTIKNELSLPKEGSLDIFAQDEIFKKVVGEEKYGYAKIYGIGIKVSCFCSKMCTLKLSNNKRKAKKKLTI